MYFASQALLILPFSFNLLEKLKVDWYSSVYS